MKWMQRFKNGNAERRLAALGKAAATLALALGYTASANAQSAKLSSATLNQIAAIAADKATRTVAQQKMDSQLIYAARENHRLAAVSRAPQLRADVRLEADGRVKVDIRAVVTATLLQQITNSGGQVISLFPSLHRIEALLPLSAIESLAARNDVIFIQRAARPINNRPNISTQKSAILRPGSGTTITRTPSQGTKVLGTTMQRKMPNAKTFRVAQILSRQIGAAGVGTNVGSVTSEGDFAHRAAEARSTYGIDGTGVKIGVLSNGVNSLSTSISTGDLPADTTVLSGQAGDGDEGTAMLEIVHDLAPGAKLYFATAFNGEDSMAQNIHDLRSAGCDIIVDDVSYFDESPFQAGVIEQAVYDVSNSGGLYFSSARNSGNKDHGTSGTWTGDFVDGGAATIATGRLHDFGGSTYDIVSNVSTDDELDLFWSDPLGASSNDYDLYVTDSNGNVVVASTTTQNGGQDPYEHIDTISDGERVVIVKATTAAARYLYLDTGRGQLAINTPGNVSGHNAAGADNAFSVAATRVSGTTPFVGGASNPVEYFSSDGPRHLFYNPDGTVITPGNVSSTGGRILPKPDITAADGVSTSVSGYSPFYGTSAAAPHAAAIAGLLLSYNHSLTPAQVRNALQSTALDIEAPGYDRDSGYGIITVPAAIASIVTAAPIANADSISVQAESSATQVNVLGNDTSPSNYTLTVTAVTQPQHGTVTLNNGQVFYQPAAGFHGTDSFTYTISDGHGGTATGTVTVTVLDNAPVVSNRSVSTFANRPVQITLSASDVDNDALTYIIVSGPSHGSLSVVGSSVTYTPTAGFVGSDSFTFKANDGTLDSNIATVSITVKPYIRHVSGYGTIATSGNRKGKFGFSATTVNGGPQAFGTFTFSRNNGPVIVNAIVQILTVNDAGTSGTFSGVYKLGKQQGAPTLTFVVTVTHAPNSIDTFSLQMYRSNQSLYYSASGPLTSGSISIS